ncbi:MAG: acyl-CoA dehydrogenase [Desulfobacterales bacterium]|nr:acyl-CoA dehydrogenase [Desulfobacterales bacterium]
MVDFSLSEKDQEIINEIRRAGLVVRKYARYYDEHEDELIPEEFPEAKDFDHIDFMSLDRSKDDTSPTVFGLLATIHRIWGDFMRLRLPNQALGNASLMAAGTEEQKQKWGETVLAMANTEPGCGSDSKAIETTAELDGDEWVLNGEKIFVTTGIRADGSVIWATIDKSAGRGGIKAFVVMKDTPGFELVKKEKKMGIRSSDTAAFVLKNCRIPRENLLGRDEEVKKGGGGFKGLMKTFNLTRPGVAAMGIGNVLACLDFIVDELKKERIEVNWEAGQHKRSAVQQKLIELEAELEAATLATLRAGWLMDKGKPNNMEASVSKAKGGDVCRKSIQLALEILGAMSITHDHLVEKWFRDARITDIYEGTGEIQRLVIARGILGYSSADLK